MLHEGQLECEDVGDGGVVDDGGGVVGCLAQLLVDLLLFCCDYLLYDAAFVEKTHDDLGLVLFVAGEERVGALGDVVYDEEQGLEQHEEEVDGDDCVEECGGVGVGGVEDQPDGIGEHHAD